ncbi:hypothetical protein GCM10009839_66950 [Catenulispora yoronensis]|uniref:Uncharacterized protein n=1 Tax=Catenulispora yoronensis TaxID=450799 RepID=A0ABP5GQD5_9ACTN
MAFLQQNPEPQSDDHHADKHEHPADQEAASASAPAPSELDDKNAADQDRQDSPNGQEDFDAHSSPVGPSRLS